MDEKHVEDVPRHKKRGAECAEAYRVSMQVNPVGIYGQEWEYDPSQIDPEAEITEPEDYVLDRQLSNLLILEAYVIWDERIGHQDEHFDVKV